MFSDHQTPSSHRRAEENEESLSVQVNQLEQCDCIKRGTKLLPPANQQWSHATNTYQMLSDVLANDEYTAIEADLLMGHLEGHPKTETPIAIMSHPPVKESDLSLQEFLSLATGQEKRTLQKHIKLDIKEVEVVPHIFKEIQKLGSIHPNGKTIFLNKDILPGPGKRSYQVKFDVGDYFDAVLQGMDSVLQTNYLNKTESETITFALSVSHFVDNRSLEGYSIDDMVRFLDVLKNHNITKRSMGIVYTPNARLVVKNFEPIDYLMNQLPLADIVVWTGYGEPAISQTKINKIAKHFTGEETMDRVGFDCLVAPSYVYGLASDTFVDMQGMYLHMVGRLS